MCSNGQQKEIPGAPKTAPPLDEDRATSEDREDPRSRGCWPCFKLHRPSEPKFNHAAGWVECEHCALRMEYCPRLGYTGKHMMKIKPEVVILGMEKLKEMFDKDPHGVPNRNQAKAALKTADA